MIGTATTTAIIYTRVSSDEQARGYSLSTQLDSCRRYCAEHEYDIVGEFSDAHSGTELDRPGLNSAIDAAKTLRPGVVLLHDVDRIGREIIVQAIAERDLTRHGARIEFVLGGGNSTPEQELLKIMKQAIAVYENRQRVERSRRGKEGRVKAGFPLVAARPAYGYRYVAGDRTGELLPDDVEAPIVLRIFAWCVDDGLTTYAIAKRLHADKVPTRGDDDPVVAKKTEAHFWDPSTVARILRNTIYKGEWFWNKTKRVREGDRMVQRPRPKNEWLSLAVVPLVTVETWDRAQLQIDRNRQMATRNTKHTYLLRGLVWCPCGRRWTGRYKNHLDRAYYRCPTTEGEPWRTDCPARFGIEQKRLESAVLDAVKTFLLDPDVRAAALDADRQEAATDRLKKEAVVADVDQRIARLDRQLGKLLDQVLVGDFPAEMVDVRKRDLMGERVRLADERRAAVAAIAAPYVDIEDAIGQIAPIVAAAFAVATTEELREILELLRVEVHVIDREHVRISGVIRTDVTLSRTQKQSNYSESTFGFDVALQRLRRTIDRQRSPLYDTSVGTPDIGPDAFGRLTAPNEATDPKGSTVRKERRSPSSSADHRTHDSERPVVGEDLPFGEASSLTAGFFVAGRSPKGGDL